MNRLFTSLFATAALTVVPAASFAHDAVRVDLDFGRPHVVEHTTDVWVEPVYRTVVDHVFVAPTYRTVTDHVWVAGAAQNVTQSVWVPDRYEVRDIVRFEHGHRLVVRGQVLVNAGHYEDQVQQVATPGHFEDVQRQELVCAGHNEDVQRQEVVTAGHYETRVVDVEHHDDIAVRFPIHW